MNLRLSAFVLTMVGAGCASHVAPAPPVDLASVESTTILTPDQVEQVGMLEAETVLDGSAGQVRHDEAWLWARRELSAAQARLGVPVLWKECGAGSAERYVVTRARQFSWSSDEDSYSLRVDPATGSGQWLHAGRHSPGDEVDFKVIHSRRELDSLQVTRLQQAMASLQVTRFPADTGNGYCTHSPIMTFETCLAGSYRMTYDACATSFNAPGKGPSAFRAAGDLLRALAPDPDPAEAPEE